MKNIKFIDRQEEIKRIKNLSKENFFLVLTGRRRIGKTALLRKAFPHAMYIFIWPNKSISWILEETSREFNFPTFTTLKDLAAYIMDKKRILIIDEFQNLLNIDKSAYGELQKIIDDMKISNSFIKISVASSSYSLMNKVFNDVASPLYGRRTDEITLTNLPIKELFIELNISIEDFIKLWAVFEGVPYYYELINKESAEANIKRILLTRNAQLQEEGRALMSMEFGNDSKTYETVLAAISEGKTKLNEIASLFGNKKNEVIKYLNILRKDFKMVIKSTPLTEEPGTSKKGRYEVIDNFLSFWFYFVDKFRGYIEQERFSEVEEFFDKNFNTFVGRRFEALILNLIKNKIILNEFNFSKIGRQWGEFKDKNQIIPYEIDIVGLNNDKREILFCECKWKNRINAVEIVNGLKNKAKYIKWNNDLRKEKYAVFAKSFSKRIDKFEGNNVYCFDLKDLESVLRR